MSSKITLQLTWFIPITPISTYARGIREILHSSIKKSFLYFILEWSSKFRNFLEIRAVYERELIRVRDEVSKSNKCRLAIRRRRPLSLGFRSVIQYRFTLLLLRILESHVFLVFYAIKSIAIFQRNVISSQ